MHIVGEDDTIASQRCRLLRPPTPRRHRQPLTGRHVVVRCGRLPWRRLVLGCSGEQGRPIRAAPMPVANELLGAHDAPLGAEAHQLLRINSHVHIRARNSTSAAHAADRRNVGSRFHAASTSRGACHDRATCRLRWRQPWNCSVRAQSVRHRAGRTYLFGWDSVTRRIYWCNRFRRAPLAPRNCTAPEGMTALNRAPARGTRHLRVRTATGVQRAGAARYPVTASVCPHPGDWRCGVKTSHPEAGQPLLPTDLRGGNHCFGATRPNVQHGVAGEEIRARGLTDGRRVRW